MVLVLYVFLLINNNNPIEYTDPKYLRWLLSTGRRETYNDTMHQPKMKYLRRCTWRMTARKYRYLPKFPMTRSQILFYSYPNIATPIYFLISLFQTLNFENKYHCKLKQMKYIYI